MLNRRDDDPFESLASPSRIRFFQSYLRTQLPGLLYPNIQKLKIRFWRRSGASGSDATPEEEAAAACLHLSILVTGSLISATPLRTGSLLLYSDLRLLLLKCENL